MAVGSDNWADAPLLALETYSTPTPNGSYTTESFEEPQASDWEYQRSAWWKIVLPDTYDMNVDDYQINLDFSIRGDDASRPYMFLYRVTDGVLEEIDDSSYFYLYDVFPGETLYLKVVQWQGEVDPISYVVGFGAVTYTLTDWEQGADYTTTERAAYYLRCDYGGFHMLSYTPPPGDPASFRGPTAPTSTMNGAINDARAFLASHDEAKSYSTGFYGNDGTIVGSSGYGASVEIAAHADSMDGPWSGYGRKDHIGGMFFPNLSSESYSYQGLLGSSRPTPTAQPILESTPFVVHALNGRMPIVTYSNDAMANPLHVRTYVRPANSLGDPSGTPTLIDDRVWSSNDNAITWLSFTTTEIGSTGAVTIFPVTDLSDSTPWAAAYAGAAGEGGYRGMARRDVIGEYQGRAYPQASALVTPPRHRWRIRHYLDQPLADYSGRIYWTADDTETVNFWDSAVGEIKRLTAYNEALPQILDHDDTYLIGNEGGFGAGMFLPDGNILFRLDAYGSEPATIAVIVDANLDPAPSSLWTQDMDAPMTAVTTAEARYCIGLVAEGQIWLHWYPSGRTEYTQASWVRFDATGTAVEQAAIFPNGEDESGSWGGSYVYRDGFLYRALNANEGTFDRYRLSDGTWERAFIEDPPNTNGGSVFVGITTAGDFVFSMGYRSNDGSQSYPYAEAGKKLWVLKAADVVFTSGVFNLYAPTSLYSIDRTWSLSPPGLGYENYYTEGQAGANEIMVRGDYAYFGVQYTSGFGFDENYICYGERGALWRVNLLNGLVEKVFGIPYGGYFVDGTFTDDANLNWLGQTSGFMFGLFDAPPAPGVTLVAEFTWVLDANGWIVHFDGSPSTSGPGVTYSWDFADLTVAVVAQDTSSQVVDHFYNVPATYAVTLTVSDELGSTASVTHDVVVPGGAIIGTPLGVIRNFSQ